MKYALNLSLILSFFVVQTASAKIPKRLKGKVFFSTEKVLDSAEAKVVKAFKKAKPKIVLKRQKDKRWKVTVVAFFKKAAAKGPITVWFYNAANKAPLKKQDPVFVQSLNVEAKNHLVYELDIDPNDGFNKMKSYWIYFGQIFGSKNKIYAKGKVQLDP